MACVCAGLRPGDGSGCDDDSRTAAERLFAAARFGRADEWRARTTAHGKASPAFLILAGDLVDAHLLPASAVAEMSLTYC